MKTISECASNGLTIILTLDNDGNSTGKYLVFSASGAWTQRLFNSPAEAIAAIEKAEKAEDAEGALWEVLSQHACKDLVIVLKPSHKKDRENDFFVFTKTGCYKDGPISLEKALKWTQGQGHDDEEDDEIDQQASPKRIRP